jgi:hypothetical protein
MIAANWAFMSARGAPRWARSGIIRAAAPACGMGQSRRVVACYIAALVLRRGAGALQFLSQLG